VIYRSTIAYATMMTILMACTTTTTSRALEDRSSEQRILTASDLRAVSAVTLYEAVSELRPNFVRPNILGEPPTVFVNGSLAGSIDVLRQLTPGTVKEVRLLRGIDATASHGTAHTGSIIEVTLRSR
jgi:hypothetical protein